MIPLIPNTWTRRIFTASFHSCIDACQRKLEIKFCLFSLHHHSAQKNSVAPPKFNLNLPWFMQRAFFVLHCSLCPHAQKTISDLEIKILSFNQIPRWKVRICNVEFADSFFSVPRKVEQHVRMPLNASKRGDSISRAEILGCFIDKK